ncbi:MAG: hydroxypyruvate isomerase [Crocinitomicaceae bacterium]|jgi:hydroxypyruvate isomerase
MRLAANLSLMFTEVPLLERFMKAKNSGFKTVEIQFPYVESIDNLVKAKTEAGVEICLINLPVGDLMEGGEGLACVPSRQAEFEQAIELCYDYAKALGVKLVNVLPGRNIDISKRSEYLFTLKHNLKKTARVFKELNVLVTFEAVNTKDMPHFIIFNSKQMYDILMEVNHPNLKMQFDIYHMQLMEGHVDVNIKKYIDLIGHIQFADTPNRGEPLTGNLNFYKIFESINFSNYHGYLAAEYKPTVQTEDSLQWMQQFDLNWLNTRAIVS